MKNKLIVVIVLNAALLTGIILGAKCASDVQRELYIAHSLESLVTPADNTFSPAARAYLLQWIGISTETLTRTRKFAFGSRRKIDDALDRLHRARARLTQSLATEPGSDLQPLPDDHKASESDAGLRG